AREGNGQNSFHKGSTNILGALVRQRRWRQADAARTHLRLVPKRAHPRTGSRGRGLAASPCKTPVHAQGWRRARRPDPQCPARGRDDSDGGGPNERPSPFGRWSRGRLLLPGGRRRPSSLIRKALAASTHPAATFATFRSSWPRDVRSPSSSASIPTARIPSPLSRPATPM